MECRYDKSHSRGLTGGAAVNTKSRTARRQHKGVNVYMKARGAVLTRRGTHQAPVENWGVLRAGDTVEIVRHAQVIASGEVEEVSLSGNVLWIVPAGHERQLFLKSEGVLVRRA